MTGFSVSAGNGTHAYVSGKYFTNQGIPQPLSHHYSVCDTSFFVLFPVPFSGSGGGAGRKDITLHFIYFLTFLEVWKGKVATIWVKALGEF